jgi:SAM-dependent methyltransferase
VAELAPTDPDPAGNRPLFEPDEEAERLVSSIFELKSTDRVLDFGSGTGGLAFALAPLVDVVVGVDSDSEQVEDCRDASSAAGLNARFEGFDLRIPEIPPKAGTAVQLSIDDLAAKYDKHFDLVCSLTTFAEFDARQAARALRLFSRVLGPGGHVLFGCRLNMSFAPTDRMLPVESNEGATAEDAAIELSDLLAILADEGFRPVTLSFGWWRAQRSNRARVQGEFDLVLAARQPSLPPGFSKARYLKLHPDVAAANIDPIEHYMLHGFDEGRQT